MSTTAYSTTTASRRPAHAPPVPWASERQARSNDKKLSRPTSTQPKGCIMQFDSKSVSLADRNKHQLGVETDNEQFGGTQPRIKDMSIRCLNRFPATLGALSLLVTTSLPVFATDGPGGGPRDNNGPGCNLFPAAASIGTRVPLSYFGPPPSETNPSLVGPEQELKSGQLDAINGRITLPLYLGYLTEPRSRYGTS